MNHARVKMAKRFMVATRMTSNVRGGNDAIKPGSLALSRFLRWLGIGPQKIGELAIFQVPSNRHEGHLAAPSELIRMVRDLRRANIWRC